MATYIKGVTDYIPQLETFKPDYKFMSDVLNVRQDRYDSNFKTLNNLYSKVVHAPLSREDNLETRNQYANTLSNGLKQVSGIDLSLQQNVDIAKGLFKPFFDDKKVVKDMAFTKLYSKEMQQANSYMTSASEEMRDEYWQVGVEDLKYQMQDYKAADADAAVSMPMPSYVANPNIYERSFEALKESELSIKQTTLEGDWIITTQNGTALTRQIVGYEMNPDGKTFKLDQENREIPIYRNPAAEYLKNTVMKDPVVLRGLITEAKVKQRQFSESEENIQKYGSVEGAKQFWATDIIERQSKADLTELVEKESELKKETIAARNWDNYKRVNNIIPGTPEDELYLLSQFNKKLVKENRDAVKSRIIDSKAPVSDVDGLLNKAYSLYMAGVMGPKMNAAAVAYSQVDAEQTFEANPFKKMEHQHRYDLNRMAIQNSYDLNKIIAKGKIDMALAEYKASNDNNNNGSANRLGLDGGMFVEEGDANVSGALTGVDLDGDGIIDADERVNVNVLEENKTAQQELGNQQTNTEIAFLETLLRELPNDMLDESMYKGNGQLTYSYYDPNTKQTTQKTSSLNVAWDDLNDGNPANRTEFNRILNNMSDKYTNLVQTSDGTSLNYDLANLNLKPALASIIHEQYKSVLKGRERLNLKVEEMNKVYNQAHDYAVLKDAEMENSASYGGQDFSIPPILLTQGELDMLNKGVPWYQVHEASKNGTLKEPIVDGQGVPVRKALTDVEYSTMYANMNYLMDHQRAQFKEKQPTGGGVVGPVMRVSGDEDDYEFLVSENGFFNDTETLAQRYWNHNGSGGGGFSSPTTGIPTVVSGVTNPNNNNKPAGWNFDREKALEEGLERYEQQKSNMNSVMSSDVAADQGLVYNLRAQMLGQDEEGVGETAYNTYTSTYDVASQSSVALAQMESIVKSIQQIPAQNLDYTYSLGNNLDKNTAQINGGDASYNALMKKILKHTLMDINTGRLDKTDGRPYIFSTYVEKVGGPDQENDIAGYNIGYGMEYAKNYKHLFIDSDGKPDTKNFAKFAADGMTITIPKQFDNNPYKSTNQMLSYTDLAIKDNGFYESVPVIGGGSYSIYKNSSTGQYIQETKTYLFNDKTGGNPPNDVVSIILGVDPQQLDNITVNMDQYLTNLATSNANKKTAWDLKNSKTTPEKK